MIADWMYDAVVSPIITEKSMRIAGLHNTYGLKIATTANKLQVKQAVEATFNVVVKKVWVLNYQGKMKKSKNKMSQRRHWKKAYVRLAEGHSLSQYFNQ